MPDGERMNFINENTRKLYEKIAKFETLGVSEDETLRVLGMELEEFNKIKQDENYKVIYAELIEKKLEEIDILNRGWDAVEEMALERVMTKLSVGSDPDYALKAAALANRATRKQTSNKTIDGSFDERRANISLTSKFVLKLEKVGIDERVIDHEPKKNQDFAPPEKVETLLIEAKNDEVDLSFMPNMTQEKEKTGV